MLGEQGEGRDFGVVRPCSASAASMCDRRVCCSRLSAKPVESSGFTWEVTTRGVGAHQITLITVFTVDPARQTELVDALDASTQKIFVTMPGLLSANLHVGIDGTRVINYAQWTSEQAYADAMSRDNLCEHLTEIASIAESYDPTLVRVHRDPPRAGFVIRRRSGRARRYHCAIERWWHG